MTPEPQGILVLVGLFVLAVAGMALGWRRQARRSLETVTQIPGVPDLAALGDRLCEPVAATYVSTTTAGDWLDRVVAHDLGVRSAATVQVHQAGVVIARTGARDVFLPAAGLRGVERTPGIAGKFVGGDGLVVIRWENPRVSGRSEDGRPGELPGTGPQVLDTGLRVRRAADRPLLTAAVAVLLAGSPSAAGETDTGTTDVTPAEEKP